MTNKKVLFLVNSDIILYNFKRELVEQLLLNGAEVIMVSPYGKKFDYFIEKGCQFIDLPINRHGKSALEDYHLYKMYKDIMKRVKPDVVLTATIKPNIYGGMVAKQLGIPYIANITGLGSAIHNPGLMKKFTLSLYKYALKKAHAVFFENKENRDVFRMAKIALGHHHLVSGAGVNIDDFSFTAYPEQQLPIKFLFLGRLMRDKGINELSEAAKRIKDENYEVEFHVAGFCDDAKIKETFDSYVEQGYIIYHGNVCDVKSLIQNSHVIVLPSYHEGLANVLLEASSMGRPILASNISGCKEAFDEGITGLGFTSKSIDSLVEAFKTFIEIPYEQKREMGVLARRKMEQEFDRSLVVNEYIQTIQTALNKNKR
jgi:glycosyltransferase involved in cell wall biosynthesis